MPRVRVGARSAKSRRPVFAPVFLWASLVFLVWPASVHAHPLAPVDLTAVLTPERAELSLDLGWHVLTADMADSDAADAYLRTQLHSTGEARAAWLRRLQTWFAARIHLTCDDNAVGLRITLPDLEAAGQAELPPETLPSLHVEGAAPFLRPPRACIVSLDEGLGTAVLRLRRPGRFAEDVRLLSPGVSSPPFALSPTTGAERSTAAGPTDPIAADRDSSDPAPLATDPLATASTPTDTPPDPGLAEYIVTGFRHILPAGLDHVLFVLGLFLAGNTLGSTGRSGHARLLLWQVTAFTVAHSLTLALGLAGIARLSPDIVEPAIAASIAFVALEDAFSQGASLRRRVVVVFLFGLIHGLGFAGALQAAGLPQSRFLVTLVGFNVGVELGQLTVLAVAFAATSPLRGWPGYDRWVRRPVCLAIAATGLYWIFERLA